MSTRRQRRTVRFACMVLIGLLYVVSVPWYRDDGAPLRLWFGLPDWVAVALLCYVAVAFVNGVAWFVTDLPDTIDGSEDSEAPR